MLFEFVVITVPDIKKVIRAVDRGTEFDYKEIFHRV